MTTDQTLGEPRHCKCGGFQPAHCGSAAELVVNTCPGPPEPYLVQRVPDRVQIEAILDKYLADLHCTLFGRAYDVISTRSRNECIQFLADIVEYVESQRV